MKYKIIALCGKAGSGKDTILKKIVSNSDSVNEIISCTTRPKRQGEQEGINYFYYTNEEFSNKLLANEMLEATCFNGWAYGTSYDSLSKNKVNIGVFNPEGIEIIMTDPNVDLIVYYITASDKQRLLRQLNREDNPNIDEIIRRYKTDEEDFSELPFYYNELKNESLSDLTYCEKVINAGINLIKANNN